MELIEMLRKWAEIEPDKMNGHWLEFTDNQLKLSHLANIQYTVQQAIEAREWDYELTCLQGEKLYLASIPKNYWRDDKDSVYQAGWSDEPFTSLAEALLSAYLQALEGQTEAIDADSA